MKWEMDTQGNVTLYPVTGFHVAPAAETTVLARIEFARTPAQLRKPEGMQFALTPQQALQFVEDLRKTAEHILSLRSQGKPN